ncbi:hypothetical protein HGRIS_003642 [Hohenbuehelia grisea]|uniref:Uncharacterized protein n=1 Tax=Hohenbuehelia grisea TaxID=104357 RepID=A0ABR3JG37_9AGAR
MPAVLSKPSILAFSEASTTLAESGNHHQAGIEVVIVVVVIAGFTIVYLACRAIIAYQARRNDKVADGIETREVLAIQDIEKAVDTEKHLDVKPFVFIPADTEYIVDSPSPPASSEAVSVPLITAFSSPMRFEDDDDDCDEEGDEPWISESLSTPSTPNLFNFWMQHDSASDADTSSDVTIVDTYSIDETVLKRGTFAEQEVKIAEATEDATVEACIAVVEEWPVDLPATSPSGTYPTSLISAFSCPMNFEDDDDDEERDDYDEESGKSSLTAAVAPGSSTPNLLNFWMSPDAAFFRARSATGRAITIDAKVYIMGETIPKRKMFAEKAVNICEATEGAAVEACSAIIEEWLDNDSVTVVNEPCASSDTIPTVLSISTSTPSPISKANKSSTPPLRKPLTSLKPNLPSFRGTLSKISKASTPPKTPAPKVSTPGKASSLRAPSTTAKAPSFSSLRTLIKPSTPATTTSTNKKSASLAMSSRSLSGTSASTPKASMKTGSAAKTPTPTNPRVSSSLFLGRRKLGSSITSLTRSPATRAMPAWR